MSVCPYPEKRNHLSFVYISPTLVIDTSMEWSSPVLHHGNTKICYFLSSKFEFWLVLNSWNHLIFVNISPTLVIDTSKMEKSSLVLQHDLDVSLKNWFFFLISKLSFDLFWLNMLTYMMTSGIHRRPFEGRHLFLNIQFTFGTDTVDTLTSICRLVLVDWSYFLIGMLYLLFIFIFVRYLGGMVPPCRYTQSSIKGINIEGCKITIGSEPITQGCKTT